MIPKILQDIQSDLNSYNAKAFIVGGFSRDYIMDNCIDYKDIDVEVFGIEYHNLVSVLSKYGEINEVGKSFGVIKIKIDDTDYDFSIPRKETKSGKGYSGFDIHTDHNMSIEHSALRRDFTINAIYIDCDGHIHDPCHGIDDINNMILRPVSESFKEDPLRVLRACQFASRFDLIVDDSFNYYATVVKNEYSDLSKERIWTEWEKWASKSIVPSKGLKVLNDCGWIHLYPEIANMIYVMQDKIYHPEKTVFLHTGFVCDYMCDLCQRDNIKGEDRVVLMFSALCHDMGKVTHTQFKNNGRIGSKGHESASVPLAESFLNSIGCPKNVIKRVLPLVKNHMCGNIELSDKAIKRLSYRLLPECIDNLVLLCESDQCGRPPLPKVISDKLQFLKNKSKELNVNKVAPKPLINGNDLIELGYKPGFELGRILKKLYEMQLNESFSNKEKGLKLSKGI